MGDKKGSTMKPKMILMMGGQGVGKGTFARKLMEGGQYEYIETGAILRGLPPESKIAGIIARGELVPDSDLFELLATHFDTSSDMILDGFPRTLGQAKWIVENYSNKFDIRVIFLDVPESVMLSRIEKRIREGGNRADDVDADVVRRRLDNFWRITMPAIEWLRTAPGIKFSDIDVTDPDADKNFVKILAALN
jgi:adenylate kinase family enzyme